MNEPQDDSQTLGDWLTCWGHGFLCGVGFMIALVLIFDCR